MEYIAVIVVAAAAFGFFWLMDKVFTKIFRSRSQHISGKSVRLNKRFGSMGLIISIFGIGVLFAGLGKNWLLMACGVFLVLLGVASIVYYLTFGIFYDEDSFVLTTFGKRSTTYRYADISNQQLYVTTGNQVIIELYMADGRSVQLQSTMTGVYDFMDKAFYKWLEQTDRRQEDCSFYDPANSCWFPPVEG